MDKVYGSYFKLDDLYEQLYSKHFKTHYNGVHTKRYLKLMEQINRAEHFTDSNIELTEAELQKLSHLYRDRAAEIAYDNECYRT